MFIESRPVTGYGETAGWKLPLMPQEEVPRVPLRPVLSKVASSTPSLSGMEQTIPPTRKQAPDNTANPSNPYSRGLQHNVMPFQEFIKRTPPVEDGKPLPPPPLRPRRSSFGDTPSVYSRDASSREASPTAPKRTSSIYSRTVSQWIPDSPVWSASDLADNPMPALPAEYLRPIAYSASTPELVDRAPTPTLLQPRAYQPLLTTPSPTISRKTTPSPAPTSSLRGTRASILLPSAVGVAAIPKTHLRTVSLEKAKATANAPGAEHLLPEELRAKSKGKELPKARSLEPMVKSPEPVEPVARRKDTLAMFGRSIDLTNAPDMPSMTLVDAEGRDRVVGAQRLSVAPLPTFSFPSESVRSPVHPMNAFPVGNNPPRTMVSLTAQNNHNMDPTQRGQIIHERGRSIHRIPRDSRYNYYQPNGRRRESSSLARGEDDAQVVANEYHSLLAEQYRQASASTASRSINSDTEVGEHMRMVPQPLFHGRPTARQSGQISSGRHDSGTGSVSPFYLRQQSDSSLSTPSQRSGQNRLPTTPPHLSLRGNSYHRRSSMGTIPISPPFPYDTYPTTTAMPTTPQPRNIPIHRRNSNDNRVSAYWHIPTKGGGNELVFRRSKEKQPSIPKIVGPSASSSPKSPGVPLLAADIIAERLLTPEATPEHSPLLHQPLSTHHLHQQSATSLTYPQTLTPSSIASKQTDTPKEKEKELTAKQALFSRLTKGAVKYADKLTRPTGYEPREKDTPPQEYEPSTLATLHNLTKTNSPHPTARQEFPHLLPSPTKTRPNHAKKPSLGWSASAKAAFDTANGNPTTSNHQHTASHSSTTTTYTHTTTPARPLDERNTNTDGDDASAEQQRGRRGSLFATLRDFRREAKAEKRREEIKRSIRVVGVPEGDDELAGGSVLRGRSADGQQQHQRIDESEGTRPQLGGGWSRRSISWMGGVGYGYGNGGNGGAL